MTAGLRALGDQRICAAAGGRGGLVDIGDRHPDSGAGALAVFDRGLGRTPERERHNSRSAAGHQRDLLVVVVVVEASLAELDTSRRGQRPQHVAVGADRCRIAAGRRRAEQVHAVRSVSARCERREPSVELVGNEIAAGEEPEPAGVADGGRQCRRRGSTGKRGEHDRTIPAVDVQPHSITSSPPPHTCQRAIGHSSTMIGRGNLRRAVFSMRNQRRHAVARPVSHVFDRGRSSQPSLARKCRSPAPNDAPEHPPHPPRRRARTASRHSSSEHGGGCGGAKAGCCGVSRVSCRAPDLTEAGRRHSRRHSATAAARQRDRHSGAVHGSVT